MVRMGGLIWLLLAFRCQGLILNLLIQHEFQGNVALLLNYST